MLPKRTKARTNIMSYAKHHTWKSFLMECRWEKLVQPPRRAKCPVPEPFPSMLELAKGFEPLTL